MDQERNVSPKVFDIPIEIEDPLKTKSHAILSSLEGQPMKEIMAAEDDVSVKGCPRALYLIFSLMNRLLHWRIRSEPAERSETFC